MLLRRAGWRQAIVPPVLYGDLASCNGDSHSFPKRGIRIIELVPDVCVKKEVDAAILQWKFRSFAMMQGDILRFV